MPTDEERLSLELSRDEIFWLASCHMFTVMVADGRNPSAVSEAYRLVKENGKGLTTEGVNDLYQRIAMLVQAKWPDSTTFIFPDKDEEARDLHGAKPRGNGAQQS